METVMKKTDQTEESFAVLLIPVKMNTDSGHRL
jgi:hypothetical protein